jgi:hypothetical protein
MTSLFQGTPQTATSYVKTTSDSPKWQQDAIYNSIQIAQNLANRPYQSYDMPTVAELSPLQQQAYKDVVSNQNAWRGDLNYATSGFKDIAGQTTADSLADAQNPYLRQGDVGSNISQAQGMFGQAGQDITGRIGNYMSPYQQGVLDVIAKQGARNLTENLLPGVSDSFIRAGQFGSSRMGDFGSRALRDTQEAILNQQAQAAQQGYGQALNAAQADASRQLSVGQAYQTAGQAQQAFGFNAANALQQAQSADLARQQGVLQNVAATAQQAQGMRAQDVAALEAAGQAQQAQQQAQLNAAKSQFDAEQQYGKQQADWLSSQIRGLAPLSDRQSSQSGITTGATYSPSPLSQLASGYFGAKAANII